MTIKNATINIKAIPTSFITVNDVLNYLSSNNTSVGMSTVYRHLIELEKEGKIRKFNESLTSSLIGSINATNPTKFKFIILSIINKKQSERIIPAFLIIPSIPIVELSFLSFIALNIPNTISKTIKTNNNFMFEFSNK